MKSKNLPKFLACVVTCSAVVQQASAITLNFGNAPGGQISFGGADNFSFTPSGVASAANESFKISASSGVGSSVGDAGTMTGPSGGWTFDPGTGAVSGSGSLDIFDGVKHFTGTLSFGTLSLNGFDTGGNLNAALTINLINTTYSGSDADLLALAAPGKAIETVTFTFSTPGHTLANLGSVAQQTSFSGSISTDNLNPPNDIPDTGFTASLLLLALAGAKGVVRVTSRNG